MGKGKAMELFGFGEPDTASAGERMKSACCGVCIGVVLFLGALGVLGWNEKRAVYTAQTIDYARSEFVQLDGCEPADASTGKLIAFQGCDPAPEEDYAPTNYELLKDVVTSGAARPAKKPRSTCGKKRKCGGRRRCESRRRHAERAHLLRAEQTRGG